MFLINMKLMTINEIIIYIKSKLHKWTFVLIIIHL